MQISGRRSDLHRDIEHKTFSFISPTVPGYRLRLLTYHDPWPNSSGLTRPTLRPTTKYVMANMVENKAIFTGVTPIIRRGII